MSGDVISDNSEAMGSLFHITRTLDSLGNSCGEVVSWSDWHRDSGFFRGLVYLHGAANSGYDNLDGRKIRIDLRVACIDYLVDVTSGY